MRRLLPLAALALPLVALGHLALGGGPAVAGDPPAAPARPPLVDHPLKDAKPGEYLRYAEEKDGWKKWFVERVLDVREGEVLFELAQTNDDGTKDQSVIRSDWKKIPELKAASHQQVLTDAMEEVEVNGTKLWCRHFYLEQLDNPPYPEPKSRRDVWYSNDIPCSGKVKELPGSRLIVSWGTMSEEELKRRQEAWKQAEKRRREGSR